MKFEEKFIRIWSRKSIVKKTTVYQQLAIFLPQIILLCSPSTTHLNVSHISLTLCSAWQCTTNTPCGRPEARIHMRVVQPAVLEDGHLSLPSLLLGRQDKHPSGPVCTGCCLPISVLLPFGIPAHYAWRNCEIAVINKLNMGLQCHNIAVKVISFWTA